VELILFPRLRIYFADFPNLFAFHSIDCNSWIPVAVMCTAVAFVMLTGMFQGAGQRHRTPLSKGVIA